MQTSCSKVFSMGVHLVGLLRNLFDSLYRMPLTSSVNTNFTFSVSSKRTCWKIRLNSGSFRIRTNSGLLMGARLTRMGSRPRSSGMRSSTLAIENDPLPMKRIWSVLISPYLVLIVVPSIRGNRSRCTPYVDTPFPDTDIGPSGTASLSISSRKTIPSSSTCLMASFWMSIEV